MTWQPTGVAVATLGAGSMREVTVGHRTLLLVRLSEAVFAVEALCPHLGGLLADGSLEGHRLTCPEHAAVFDARDGSVVADPFGVEPPEGAVAPLDRYPTRIVSGMVEVDLPAP